MFRFFYRYYRRCTLVGILLLVGASIYFNLTIAEFFFGTLLLIWLPVWFVSLYGSRCVRAYTEGCDPEPLLDLALWDVRRYEKARFSRGKAARENSYFNAVIALSGLGRHKEALHYLDVIDRSALSPKLCATYWLDRFSVLLHLGEKTEELERLLSLAQDGMERARPALARYSTTQRALQYAQVLLLVRKEGPTYESTARLEGCLAAATMEYERVSIHLALARSKLALGDQPAAEAHLNYVLSHGNKLYARVQAEEILADLKRKNRPIL